MKKLIFILLALFIVPAFGVPTCAVNQEMNGELCAIPHQYSISLKLPIARNGIDVEIKPFICDIMTNYKSSVQGFTSEYRMDLLNVTFYRPNNFIYNQDSIYIDKDIGTYILKTSGGKIDEIYQEGQFNIYNKGCSSYDPDCHKIDQHDDDLIISCRVLN